MVNAAKKQRVTKAAVAVAAPAAPAAPAVAAAKPLSAAMKKKAKALAEQTFAALVRLLVLSARSAFSLRALRFLWPQLRLASCHGLMWVIWRL